MSVYVHQKMHDWKKMRLSKFHATRLNPCQDMACDESCLSLQSLSTPRVVTARDVRESVLSCV